MRKILNPFRLGFGAAACLLGLAAAAATTGMTEAPLAPRSGPRGATMFKLLPPAQTGIVNDNQYDDPKMWGEHYQELALGAMGTGVAIGDFDNDGRPDIFIVSKTASSPCRLFRNLGDWKFEDVTDKAGLGGRAPAGMLDQGLNWLKQATGQMEAPKDDGTAWRQGAVFADVNNDGWLDIFVGRFNAPNLLYINQHDGTFKEEAVARGLGVADACGVGAFCDYDRDGWLDVYITTNMLDAAKHPNGQRGYLFHNNGDGTFTNVTEKAGIYGPMLSHSATWWDFDGDGWPDLYVTNDFAGTDRLYHNQHDGTFTDVIGRAAPHIPYSSMGADFGDINNDGRPDFFVADMASTTHEMDQRGMAYSRALNTNDDGGEGGVVQYSRNALFVNTGTGRFLEAAFLSGLSATDWTWSVRFEDLDNDGRLDLFVTNGMNREYQNADLRDRIILAESGEERMRLMKASPPLAEVHLAYRNLGDLQFEETGAAWGLNQRGVSFGTALGDLDGDGDLDIVYANYQSAATVLRNDSDAGHRLIVALRGTRSNRFGIGATVRIESAAGVQVRTLMVARGYLSSSEPVAHFGLGGDAVIDRLVVDWPSGQSQTFTHVAVDRRLTITEPDTPAAPKPVPPPPAGQFVDVSEAVHFAFPAGADRRRGPGSQALLPANYRGRSPALAAGGLDADSHDAVIIGRNASDSLRLLRGTGGTFESRDASVFADRTPLEQGAILIFDANGDGANDVLTTHSGDALPAGAGEYQPSLFLNDGRGNFRPAPEALPPLPISVGAAAAADFNRDGQLDLFIGARMTPGQYPLTPRSALLVNRDGRFEDVTDRLAPGLREAGLVRSALWSDVDGDGWPDLLLALEWGPVKYFHNEQGRGFVERTDQAGFAAAGHGLWASLASADFNGDGRPDYVAGNLGLNTQYRGTPEHPMVLYYGQFTPGRPPVLVEGYYEGDKLYPRSTRKDLGAQIPLVLQRYPRNNPYARATLENILGTDKLDAARRYTVTELRSGVFLSQPDGTFRFEPLPRIAQIAPFQGVVAGDFDGDGHADIYAVQNLYQVIPFVGHFDGGLSQLLRGDGHGHFTAVPPLESGLVVPGDGKALAVTDLDHDGWPDFLLTRSFSSTMAWHNSGMAHRHSLAVRLAGKHGNPDAIGARVTLELADGSRQAVEITAGGGCFSQSSPIAFFGWPDGNAPRGLTVRWPDGTSSRHPVTGQATVLRIPQP